MDRPLRFSDAVAGRVGFYVYRLIDPRNGETFYVGKGRGNRVFAHAQAELDSESDMLAEKLQRIREVRKDGFDVIHILHRHGLDEATAFEVEAALIDAYPGITNLVAGRSSDERGIMHARQIIERYEAPQAVFYHSALLINISRMVAEQDSLYDAARYAWRLDPRRAERAEIILAIDQGLIIGVFIAEQWLPATAEHFPRMPIELPDRWGFVGRDAPTEVASLYVRRRVPDSMRRRGSANPIRYAVKEVTSTDLVQDRPKVNLG